MNNYRELNYVIDGHSVTNVAKKINTTVASASSRIQTQIRQFLRNKNIKNVSNFKDIKNAKSAKDVQKNLLAWRFAREGYISSMPKQPLKAITTVFKADDIQHAFDIARKQGNTLTAEEVATLMYNTIVTNYDVT